MALMGIGSNYLSQLPNESIPDSKMENTGKGKVHNAIQDEGVRYEKRHTSGNNLYVTAHHGYAVHAV